MVIDCGEGAAKNDKMLRKVAKTLTKKLAPIRDGQLEKNTDTKPNETFNYNFQSSWQHRRFGDQVVANKLPSISDRRCALQKSGGCNQNTVNTN